MEKSRNIGKIIQLPSFTDRYYTSEDKVILKAYKKIEKKIKNGEFVNVGENIGYLCMYAKERQKEFWDHLDVNKLIEELKPITNYPSEDEYFYPHLDAESYITDAYLTIKDYDTYWKLSYEKYLKRHKNKIIKTLSMSTILNFYQHCKDYKLTGHHIACVVGISDAKITKFGKENVEELLRLLDSYLEDFEEREGMDLFQYFSRKYVFLSLNSKDFDELKPYIKLNRFESLKKSYHFHVNQYKRYEKDLKRFKDKDKTLFKWRPQDFSSEKEYWKGFDEGFKRTKHLFYHDYKWKELGTNSVGEKLTVPTVFVPQIIGEAFEGYCNKILRDCENLLRKKKNLPKIGEGWIV